MKCLYCGKTINENASEPEKTHSWHAACIKKFFGTDDMPVIDISKYKLDELAKYLYEQETITGEEFMKILNAK